MGHSDANSKPSQASKICRKRVNILKPLIIFAKESILDIWLGSEYARLFQFDYYVVFRQLNLG